eukprot:4317165-Pyramimonas_sp.AAC.1
MQGRPPRTALSVECARNNRAHAPGLAAASESFTPARFGASCVRCCRAAPQLPPARFELIQFARSCHQLVGR